MDSIITICMGSSCFSRGNRENLELINAYLALHEVEARVRLSGCRCEGQCTRGPVIRIGERIFSKVDRGMLIDLLNQALVHLKAVENEASVFGIPGRDRVSVGAQMPSVLPCQGDRVLGGLADESTVVLSRCSANVIKGFRVNLKGAGVEQ